MIPPILTRRRGRPTLPDNEKRTRSLSLRVTVDEAAIIRDMSIYNDIPISELLRKALYILIEIPPTSM